jgi:Fe-S cluster assembly iron-binding protein IscA
MTSGQKGEIVMLTLTDRAAAVLAEARSRSGLSDDVGVRISGESKNGQEPSYRLTFAAEPAPEDLVVHSGVTSLFVAPEVAGQMQAAVLDVNDGGDGITLVLRGKPA